MIYVMSDLHGRYKEFMDMLKMINFTDKDNLYILGDVVDRRKNGIKILKYIMDKDNIELLRGNHEKMMIDSIFIKENNLKDEDSNIKYYQWIKNGGYVTFEEYQDEDWRTREKIIKYIENLADFKEIEVNGQRFLLIHAGIYIPEGYKVPKELSLETILKMNLEKNIHLWIREDFLDVFEYIEDYKIIFGHTPTKYIPEFKGYITPKIDNKNLKRCKENKIYIEENKIGIDCEENLACLRLDDFKEFYIKNYKEE